MKTARAVLTFALMLALLVGTGGSVLVAQTASSAAAAPSAAPAAASAVAATAAPAAETFSKEQLEQLVAPIALYADALLMQILMAATYPLEVVEADRFMRGNDKLKDAALEAALKEKDWDPSVKSLCTLPNVLKQMSENLDWTQDLGDAFLGQKDQLLDTVQIMRGKANDSGNLKTTEQQVVTVKEDKIIVIESPSPEVVYVPTYSPTVVYGGWSYPSYYYPPMYPYYPPGAGLISFGIGMAVGGAIWGNCNWGWGHHDVDINVNRYNNFNRNTNVNHNNLSGNRSSWNHDASHRKGVNYQNSKVAGQYGAKGGATRVNQGRAQAQSRGYSGDKAGTRQARTPSASTQNLQGKGGGGQGAAARDRQGSGAQGGGDRAASAKGSGNRAGAGQGTGDRATSAKGSGGAGDRAASAKASGGGQRSSGSKASSYGGGSSGRSAYGGSSSSSASRASSSRGSSSRGTMSYGGGGSRGGGGMSRGGGGGRRR